MDAATADAFDPAAMFDLSGKVALVTGCRRGIGLAMAQALAGAGADIIGVSAQLEASGSEVGASRRGGGPPVHRVRGRSQPIAQPSRSSRADLAERATPIDILVNNAGTIARAPGARPRHRDVGAHPRGQPDRAVPARAGARQRNGASAARARSSSPRRCSAFRAASSCRATRPRSPGSPAWSRRSRTSGRHTASTSTRSRPGTSRPTTPRRCATTQIAAARSSTGSPPVAGACPATSREPRSFSRRRASDYVCGTIIAVDGGWLAR